jgi:endonuclease YncB( thermonuclease family)
MRIPRSKIASAFSFFIVLTLWVSVLPALGGEYKVIRVVDGDTIRVRSASGEVTIRLVGIDAPEVSHKKNESGQPFSQQVTKYLAGLVINKTVDIKEYGHDRYGRILGVVSLGGRNINLELL